MDRIEIYSDVLTCPVCKSEEMHPDGDKVLIRAFKVQTEDGVWHSQCLVCAGYYDENLNYCEENGSRDKGWISTEFLD